jgi:Xaa-Pro aminopeptidase
MTAGAAVPAAAAGAAAIRRDRLRAMLPQEPGTAVLISRLVNVRYLTGFSGTNGALLLTRDSAILGTDGRYAEQAAGQAPDVELLVERQCARALLKRAADDPDVSQVAFEAHEVTVELFDLLQRAAPDLALVPLGRLTERLRQVKDEDEIGLLRAACAISDRALADLFSEIRPGLTEREVAWALEQRVRAHGGDGLSFDSIVASGPNSARPHHQPTDRAIERGDFLKIDFGARHQGYHADMTRTFVVAAEPAEWQRDIYELVERAQQAGLAALAPGANVKDIDLAARSVVKAAGHGEHFPHGLGHGVGLEIHEAPTIGYSTEGILDAGTPVTVEPGVYLPGRGGVRIEDTLVVRDGGPELLTTTTKELLVLG